MKLADFMLVEALQKKDSDYLCKAICEKFGLTLKLFEVDDCAQDEACSAILVIPLECKSYKVCRDPANIYSLNYTEWEWISFNRRNIPNLILDSA